MFSMVQSQTLWFAGGKVGTVALETLVILPTARKRFANFLLEGTLGPAEVEVDMVGLRVARMVGMEANKWIR